MRILRLVLRNYRGVAEREVEFAPRGVTIVAGPNEVGKSSLAEAVELLFDERDDTAKQRVREIQPVDRDAGSEVEADVELGPFSFTYAKRFHRRSETRLAVRAPRVEQATGREAHERVRALLDAHLDTALWRALRIVQGAPLDAPALAEATSLAAALDRAAGVGAGGEREESLFERARAAFDEHFTATGRARRGTVEAQQALADAQRDAELGRGRLDALERDADAEAALRDRVAELERRIADGRRALGVLDAERAELAALRSDAECALARLATGRAEESEAVAVARQRGQLVSAHAGAQAELESLAEALESEEPAHIAAGAELRHVEERLVLAREARDAAAQVVQRARRDAALRRGERERAELRERALRIGREHDEIARARDVLAAPPIDEARVAEIATAQAAMERAETRLAAEGPRVQIVPEVDLELLVDGRSVLLRAGVPAEQRVAETLVVLLPGVGDVTVIAGAGVAERRKVLEQATTRLRSLCLEAGVADHAGAVAALAVRRAAAAELARSEERLAQALGRDSAESLAQRIAALDTRLVALAAECSGEDPRPDTLEAAEHALEQAEAAAALAREGAEDLARRHEDAALRFSRCDQHRSDTYHRMELAGQTRADFERRLAAAREEAGDEELEARREARSDAARELETAARAAALRIEAREPEQIEARFARASSALAADERALREQRDALLKVGERIAVVGGEGLFERWQAAERRRARAERELAGLERRASAARKLFEVLRVERDAARHHYAAPLADAIALLGRPLYGADFAVELSDELAPVRRVLGGKSLLASQLSAGAREQLALLVRLAAARLAGGVPLWLDDALGHTDPQRLSALGPLLAAAGEASQVIVLTCSPERFRSVPDARIIELR
jgi:AAA ATPase-like protein